MIGEPMKCMIPTDPACERPRYCRGLCRQCYVILRKRVKRHMATWEQFVRAGICLPYHAKASSPAKVVIAPLLRKPRKPRTPKPAAPPVQPAAEANPAASPLARSRGIVIPRPASAGALPADAG